MKNYKSTEMILDIVNEFGDQFDDNYSDDKRLSNIRFMKALKALRKQVKREVLKSHTNATNLIKLMYE
jgi:hypothetical protein